MQKVDIQEPIRISQPDKPYLIINADDLGYSPQRDEAIFSLIDKKIVTSASLLINGESAESAISRCNQIRFVPGIHLNLTEGRPISPLQQCQSLIDPLTGQFWGKQAFHERLFQGLINMSEAESQIYLQLSQFVKNTGHLPSHFDGHNHIHILDQRLVRTIASVCQIFGVYRCRIPFQPIELFENPPSEFNRKILQGSTKAKNIFVEYGIISTDSFVGLQLISEVVQVNYERALQNISQYLSQKNLGSCEMMVHPGFLSKSGDAFNQSEDRLHEYKILCSKNIIEKISDKFTLIGWGNLSFEKPHGQKRILIHSLMNRGNGNYTAAYRLKNMFAKLGYRVYVRNILYSNSIAKQLQTRLIHQFCVNFRIDLVFGINLFRSGTLLNLAFSDPSKISYQVPYILMIAGTDANVYISKPKTHSLIMNAIANCQLMVSLNPSMATIVANEIQHSQIRIDKPSIKLIPQSQQIFQVDPLRYQSVMKTLGLTLQTRYIVFPASIRRVKGIDFALPELNQFIQKSGIQVLLLGPINEQTYYQQCVREKLGQVKFLGCVQRTQYLELLMRSVCLINTSYSEGMSNSILEALVNGVIAVARNNDGNKNLIQDRKNGYLFETPKQLLEILLQILDPVKKSEVDQIRTYARQTALNEFNSSKQEESYRSIFENHFNSRSNIAFGSQKFTIQNCIGVHPTSAVNLDIFRQINPVEADVLWDIGCGTGVFALSYLARCLDSNRPVPKRVVFADICKKALSNCYFNVLNNQHLFKQSQQILFVHSDMYDGLRHRLAEFKGQNSKLVILGNMPQTPFPAAGVKLDRNGGPSGINMNVRFITQALQFHPHRIYTLYSDLSYPKKYYVVLQKIGLAVETRTEILYHQIPKSSYDSMCPGLYEYIVEMKRRGVCQFSIQDQQEEQPRLKIGTRVLCLKSVLVASSDQQDKQSRN